MAKLHVLHTADWHLGQKFLNFDRQEEHQMALDWLKDTISKKEIDVLIIAGDVFDIQNPPNYAREMYYNFLFQLRDTNCRHIVIIGGNHDSPAMLNAPKLALKALNAYVVGSASDTSNSDVIKLKNEVGKLEAVIAAVPFLRDQDIRRSVVGETDLERIERIKLGIVRHYEKMGEEVKKYVDEKVPIIATGHLYAKGAEASADQNNIYIGNRENISASQFPAIFDYVALGHIHRAQYLGEQEHVRYSGSIIPLRFKETKDDKSVTEIIFEDRSIQSINMIPIPEFRRLKTIEGDIEKVRDSLERFAKKEREGLAPWVEIMVETDQFIPNLDADLRELVKDASLQILKIKTLRQHHALAQGAEMKDLEELDPEEVFKQKCTSYGSPPEQMEQLVGTFRELKTWMNEQED